MAAIWGVSILTEPAVGGDTRSEFTVTGVLATDQEQVLITTWSSKRPSG